MTELGALSGIDKLSNLFTPSDNFGNVKASFAKIHRALFNADGTVAKGVVPHQNPGSIHGFGYAEGSSAGASTNLYR